MKVRNFLILLTVVLIAALSGGFGLGWLWPNVTRTSAQQASPPEGSLRWYAVQAYQQGETSISLQTQPHFRGVSDLNSAISTYSLFVGQLVGETTVMDETTNSITTWYKFRISERLAQRPYAPCPYCSPPSIPSELLPLQQGEILVPLVGGSVFTDNVVVELILAGFTGFVEGQNYLLFLNFNDANSVGNLSIGPRGALLVSSDNTFMRVVAVPEGSTETISSGLAAQYGNSLTQLRAALNPTPPPPSCDPAQVQSCEDSGGTWSYSNCTCTPAFDVCLRKPWLCE